MKEIIPNNHSPKQAKRKTAKLEYYIILKYILKLVYKVRLDINRCHRKDIK